MISGLRPTRHERHRHREDDQRAVHQPRERLAEADHLGEVDQHEEVDDTQPSPAPAQDRGQVQPAQVAVVGNRPVGVPHAPGGDGGGPISAALADEQEDRDRDRERREPEHDRRAAPAEHDDDRRPDDRHDDRADVSTRDVGADREAPPLWRKLLGQEAVAHGVLRRATDAGQDVRGREGGKAGRERLGDESPAEEQPTRPQQLPPGDEPGERGEAQLDDPGGEGAPGREEGDRVDADVEVVGDLQVDERQDNRLRVVDRMGDRQQPQRPHRPHVQRAGSSRRAGLDWQGRGRRDRTHRGRSSRTTADAVASSLGIDQEPRPIEIGRDRQP